MEIKILFGGAMFLGGWLWFYMFIRQFLFNILTAYPLIRKMQALQADLIAPGAKRYTNISIAVCVGVSLIILVIVLLLCPLYLIISFAVGALIALVLFAPRLSSANRSMFDIFCGSYYRFVPDDELRTAMYNKKTGQIKVRLRAMEIEGSFIPEFKDKK